MYFACESLRFIPSIMNKKTFQSGFDKGIYGILYLSPIAAPVADGQFIDGETTVHLKIKDSFRLFKSKQAV